MNVYTGFPGEPTAPLAEQILRDAGFTITTDAAGWIAEYVAGRHHVRVEATPAGWWVSRVRLAGSYERVKRNALVDSLLEAAELAVELAAAVNKDLRTLGSVAGPLLAEIRSAS